MQTTPNPQWTKLHLTHREKGSAVPYPPRARGPRENRTTYEPFPPRTLTFREKPFATLEMRSVRAQRRNRPRRFSLPKSERSLNSVSVIGYQLAYVDCCFLKL